MCGISGYISRSSIYEQNIDKTLKLMSSRGPDNKNYIKYQSPQQANLSFTFSFKYH